MTQLLPKPSRLGFPEKFKGYRDGQEEAILSIVDDEHRFTGISAPVGTGKSMIYISVLLLTQKRGLILTGSKALQDQLISEMGAVGLVDVRGRNNFQCSGGGDTCEDGAYLGCASCPYRMQVQAAKEARLVTTNYEYWMAIRNSKSDIGEFDFLILDEAHTAPDKISSHLAISFTTEEVYRRLNLRWPKSKALSDWKPWASEAYKRANDEWRECLKKQENAHGKPPVDLLKLTKYWENLTSRLRDLRDARGYWVLSQHGHRGSSGYRWDILWPAPYCEEVLYRKIPRVVLLSGTLIRKTLAYLNLTDPEDYSFTEYPFTFPVERCRVMHLPTCRLNFRSSESDIRRWLEQIEDITTSRRNRKGLVHCVSYKRRDQIMNQLPNRKDFISHDTDDAALTINRFLRSRPPSVLISPSIETGYDFPYTDAEFQIIAKLPFLDTRPPVMRARTEADPLYGPYLMTQRLVQATGRVMRAHDDRGETFIIDDNILWVIHKYRRLFPSYYHRLVRLNQRLPAPPPALSTERGH